MKLMRSLYRLVAMQIAERFSGVLLDSVAAWLQQSGRRVKGVADAPAAAEGAAVRRAASRWRAKAAGGDSEPPVNVRAVMAALLGLLPRAQVVELAAGAEIQLHASAVVVSGRVVAVASDIAAAAPCVLVWPEFKPPSADLKVGEAEVKVQAGAGATGRCVCVCMYLLEWSVCVSCLMILRKAVVSCACGCATCVALA